jgi:hypothetical protein
MPDRIFRYDIAFLLFYVLATVYFFYPGMLSPDSVSFFKQARSGQINDWQSPFLITSVGYLDRIIAGPILPLVFQTSTLAVALYLLATSIYPQRALGRAAIYAVLILPPVWGLIGVIWADNWMHATLMLAFAVGIMGGSHPDRVKGYLLLVVASILFVAAVGLRHNAVAATPPLFAVIALLAGIRYRWVPMVIVVATVGSLTASSYLNSTLATRHMDLTQILFAYDLAGTSIEKGEILFSDRYPSIVPDVPSLDKVRENFGSGKNYVCIFRVCKKTEPFATRSDSENDIAELRADWLRAITSSTSSYLDHRMRMAKYVLGLDGGPLWYPGPALIMHKNNLGFEFSDNSLRRAYRGFLSIFLPTPLYSQAIFLLVAIGSFIVAFVSYICYSTSRFMVAAGLLASGILYEIGVIGAAVTPDFRYSLWLDITCWIGTSILIIAPSSKRIS